MNESYLLAIDVVLLFGLLLYLIFKTIPNLIRNGKSPATFIGVGLLFLVVYFTIVFNLILFYEKILFKY